MTLVAGEAVGQQPAKTLKEQLVGTWTIDSLRVERKDGTTIHPFGPKPIGILMFDDTGHFSWTVVRPGRPKFASNIRLQGTPEENQAVVQGTHAYFGIYKVNEAEQTLALHLD